MASGIDRKGPDAVLSGYDVHAKRTPLYSLWQGKLLKYAYTEDNIEEGREVLEENLAVLEQSGTNAVYSLRFHPKVDKDGFVTDKTPIIGSFNFQVNESKFFAGESGNMDGVRGGGRIGAVVDNPLLERIAALESKLAAFEDDDDEGPGEDQNSTMNMINGFLQNPAIMGLIGKVLGGGRAPVAMAGIPVETGSQDDKIQDAVTRLKACDPVLGDDLQKLAEMAETNPQYFSMLLSMLRK